VKFYVGVGSWDHEGDDFESAQISANRIGAATAIDARSDMYDTYKVYECSIGQPPKCVMRRERKEPWSL